jgi:glutaconate CoA-transferase subunit B
MEVSNVERMIITAGREINDGDIVFTGTFWPVVVSLFAKTHHAKSALLAFENGYVCDAVPPRIPLLAADCCLASAASCIGDSFTTLGMILHGGWADVALLNGANVDRLGNINTTCIGPYRKPRVRMAGSGGGCDLACLARKLVIVLEHDRKRFPEKVDFITSPGYINGKSTRLECGLITGTGPIKVVTTLGVFSFDKESKEMVLEGFYENGSIGEMKNSVQWPLKVSKDVKKITSPSEEEIHVLRSQVDPSGMFLKRVRYAEDGGGFYSV